MNRGDEPINPGLTQSGLTIREHLAELAMQGLLASVEPRDIENPTERPAPFLFSLVGAAKRLADALLAELAGPKEEENE